jgi:hypothetical protein
VRWKKVMLQREKYDTFDTTLCTVSRERFAARSPQVD